MNSTLKTKINECEKEYQLMSGKASDVGRQLSLAGIAIVWMFKPGNNLNLVMPGYLLIPLFLFSLSLFFDLLHYICSAVVWGCFHRIAEKKGKEPESELTIPSWSLWPSLTLFSLKLLYVIVGYLFVFVFFISKQ
jgi:hypothetical protein